MTRLKTAIVCFALFSLAALAFAGVPQTINYQGYLTSSGAPASGPLGMTFSLYSSNPSRSNHVWRETQPEVPVNNGIYSVQLGTVNPITAPFNVPYYLGVKVGSDDEMPLQPLSSVPYALRAQVADTVSEGGVTFASLGISCNPGQTPTMTASGWQCGTPLIAANGSGYCVGGACSLNCDPGYADCDGIAANGCEAQLATNAQNCNGCGIACPVSLNGVTACVAGVCSLTCSQEYTKCGTACTNFQNDPQNCGACGNVCGPGESCLGNQCSVPSTACNKIVINEFRLSDPLTIDFIELYNPCPVEYPLSGLEFWVYGYRISVPIPMWHQSGDVLNGTVLPNGYFIIGNTTYPDKDFTLNSNVSLLVDSIGGVSIRDTNSIVDEIPFSSIPQFEVGPYASYSRYPNGTDSGNSATDFTRTMPTPRAANTVSCSDGIKNNDEYGIDCGGPVCGGSCPEGKGCQADNHCSSSYCSNGICTAPFCNDGIKNGFESDVDCGGYCKRCPSTKSCTYDADCDSYNCLEGTCQTATCSDGRANGTEIGIDCGGGCPNTCDAMTPCTSSSECSSGICLRGTCRSATCTDSLKNGLETDVDCGGNGSGSGCLGCANGKACLDNTDCTYGLCSNNICTMPPLGSSAYNPAATCNDLKNASPASPSGVYWLDPDGAGGVSPFQAYCNMVNDGGGWTLWAYTGYNGVETSATVQPQPGTNGFIETGRYQVLLAASSQFMARGHNTGTAYFLSKTEAGAATCHNLTFPIPEQLNATAVVFGHMETSGCDVSGNDAAYLAITDNSLTVQSTGSVGLWHSVSSSGTTLNLNSTTADTIVEMYLR